MKTVDRAIYLTERRAGIERAKQLVAEGYEAIVVDPREEIICDRCNATVDEEQIYIDGWGVKCKECRQ